MMLGRSASLLNENGRAVRAGELENYNRATTIAAMALMTNLGALTMLLTPAVIASYASGGRFSAAKASMLTSVELGGMTAAVLSMSLVLPRIDRRFWVMLGLLTAAAAHLASIFAQAYPLLLLTRTVAGVGIGIVYTVSVAALAATASPDRNFGFAITSNQLSATAVLAACSWIGLGHGHGPVLGVILAFTLLMGLSIPWFPRRAPAPAAVDAVSASQAPLRLLPGLLGLAGMFMFLLGIGAVWPILGLIAQSHAIKADAVGAALAVAGLGGLGAGLLVSVLGIRLGRVGPLVIGSFGIAGSMLLLQITFDGRLLMAGATLIMFFWIFSIPYYLGAMSSLDGSGRLAVLSSAMMPFGLAAGQGLATAFGSDYPATILVSATLFVAALATMLFGLLQGANRTLLAP